METRHQSPVSILSLPTLTRYAHGIALAKIEAIWHSDPEILRLIQETGRVPSSYIVDRLLAEMKAEKLRQPRGKHRPEAMAILAAIHPDVQVSREYLDAARRDAADERHPNLREVLHVSAEDVLDQAEIDSIKQILAVMQFSGGMARMSGEEAVA